MEDCSGAVCEGRGAVGTKAAYYGDLDQSRDNKWSKPDGESREKRETVVQSIEHVYVAL